MSDNEEISGIDEMRRKRGLEEGGNNKRPSKKNRFVDDMAEGSGSEDEVEEGSDGSDMEGFINNAPSLSADSEDEDESGDERIDINDLPKDDEEDEIEDDAGYGMRPADGADHLVKIAKHTMRDHPVDKPKFWEGGKVISMFVPVDVMGNTPTTYGAINREMVGRSNDKKVVHTYVRSVAMFLRVAQKVYEQDIGVVRGVLMQVDDRPPGMFLYQGEPHERANFYVENVLNIDGSLAGYRLWLASCDPKLSLDEVFDTVITENHADMIKIRKCLDEGRAVRHNKARMSGSQSFRLIKSKDRYYNEMAIQALGREHQVISVTSTMKHIMTAGVPFAQADNPFSPTKLLKPENTFNFEDSSLVLPSQMNFQNYMKEDGLHFPEPNLVWHIGISEVDPESFFSTVIKKSKFSMERVDELRKAALPQAAADKIDLSSILRAPDPNNRIEGEQGQEEAEMSDFINAKAREYKIVMDNIRSMFEENTPEYVKAMTQTRRSLADKFYKGLMASVTDRDHLPPSVRAIIRYIKEKPAAGLSIPAVLCADNLNPMASMVMRQNFSIGAFGRMRNPDMRATAHRWHLATHDAFNDKKNEMRPHQLASGEGGTGKSWCITVNAELMIEQTFQPVASLTDASMATDDAIFDRCVMLDHEGTADKYGFGKMNPDDANTKQRLSEGFISRARARYNKDEGKTYTDLAHCRIRCLQLTAMNGALPTGQDGGKAKEYAVLQRFMISEGGTRFPSEVSSIYASLKGVSEGERPEARQLREHFHTVQAVTAMYNFGVSAGILEPPNLDEFDSVILEINSELKESSLPAIEGRTATQIKRIGHALVLTTAAMTMLGSEATHDLRFDKEGAPKPFSYEWLLEMQRYAVALKQHVAYTLTLVEEDVVPFMRFRCVMAIQQIVDDIGHSNIPYHKFFDRTKGSFDAQEDQKYRVIDRFPFEKLVDVIANQLGKDVKRTAVTAELRRMCHLTLGVGEKENKRYCPWVIIAPNGPDRKNKLVVLDGVIKFNAAPKSPADFHKKDEKEKEKEEEEPQQQQQQQQQPKGPVKEVDKDDSKVEMDANWLINTLKKIWQHSATNPLGERIIYCGVHRERGKQYTRLLPYFDLKPKPGRTRYFYVESPDDMMDEMFYYNGLAVVNEKKKENSSPFLIYKIDEDLLQIGKHLSRVGVPESEKIDYLPHKMRQRCLESRVRNPQFYAKFKFTESYPRDWVNRVFRHRTREEVSGCVENFMLTYAGDDKDEYVLGTKNDVGDSIFQAFSEMKTQSTPAVEADEREEAAEKAEGEGVMVEAQYVSPDLPKFGQVGTYLKAGSEKHFFDRFE